MVCKIDIFWKDFFWHMRYGSSSIETVEINQEIDRFWQDFNISSLFKDPMERIF